MDLIEISKKFEACDCGREHKCAIEAVKIGKNVLGEICALCKGYKNILVVSDENTYKVCGKKVCALIGEKNLKNLVLKSAGKVVVPNEESIEIIQNEITENTDLIIGVGSGVINDLCKYVSFKNNLPYYIVATAPSMDGYASVGAAMILDGMKVTVNARPPKAIIADTAILKDAPYDMLQAGYGDIIGKYSCLNDWELSALVNEEYFCRKVYNYTLDCANKVATLADGILKRDEETVGVLMEALVVVGILMSYVNSSRPASGSEHHLSHFFEITGILENAEYFAHGIDVIYSAFYTQKIREELLNIENPNCVYAISREEYEKKIRSVYHTLADEVIALQDKMGWYNECKCDIYKAKWAEIKEILSQAPSSTEVKDYIKKIGLNIEDFEAMYGKEKLENAIWFAKDLKDRYSVLWLYFELKYGENYK